MEMDRDLKSGMALKRPPASAIARMSSTIKSSFRAILSQVSTVQMVSQLPTRMDLLQHLKSEPPATLKPAPKPDGGPMVTAKAQKNGTALKRLPASPTLKTSSTAK